MTYDELEKQQLEEFIAEERAREYPDWAPAHLREQEIESAIQEFKDMLALVRAIHEAEQAEKAAEGGPLPKDSSTPEDAASP